MPRAKKKEVIQPDQHIAVYLRVSTDEQADSGLGIEAQKTRCSAMVIVRDYEAYGVRFYVDAGVSGTKDPLKRKACAEMLQQIEEGKVKAVIVSSLDRLARKIMFTLTLTESFSKAGVAFISCKEQLDTSTPQGMFVLHMFAALSELERGMISQRTIDALSEKGKIDGEKGGRMPYGYQRVFTLNEKTGEYKATGVSIHPEQEKIVQLIFQLRRQKKSMDAIATHLNQKSLISPRGGKWYASGVREILLNRNDYAGGTRGESAIPWPAILEPVFESRI
jgi:site-specific DNA recombinase